MWVLIANSSFAEIYEVEHNGLEIMRIDRINHPQGREKNKGDVYTDRPGRSFQSGGTTRHSLSGEVDLHLQEIQAFARQLASILYKSKASHLFSKLVIIAPPQFLGELRSELHPIVKSAIEKEIAKDIPASSLTDNERVEVIRKLLKLKKPVSISPWE